MNGEILTYLGHGGFCIEEDDEDSTDRRAEEGAASGRWKPADNVSVVNPNNTHAR